MRYCSVVDLTKELRPSAWVRRKLRKAEQYGLVVSEVPFVEFKEFYTSIVPVKKVEEIWDQLSKIHFAFLAKKDGVPVSGIACMFYEKQAYYSMGVTDFTSPYAEQVGCVIQTEVMKIFKEKGYELYVVGVLAEEGDAPKLKNISFFKKQLGDVYAVEGDKFPFESYTLIPKELLKSDGGEKCHV